MDTKVTTTKGAAHSVSDGKAPRSGTPPGARRPFLSAHDTNTISLFEELFHFQSGLLQHGPQRTFGHVARVIGDRSEPACPDTVATFFTNFVGYSPKKTERLYLTGNG